MAIKITVSSWKGPAQIVLCQQLCMCASLAGTGQEILFLHLTVPTGIAKCMSSNVCIKGGSVRKKAVRIHTMLYCVDSATGKFHVKDVHWYKPT